MARVNKNGKYRGSIGNKTYYIVDGEQIVRGKTSLDKERLQKGKEFENSRKSSSEFGGVSGWSKVIRENLGEFLRIWGDSKLHNRLNSANNRYIGRLPGERGNRELYLPKGSLQHFPLSSKSVSAPPLRVEVLENRRKIKINSSSLFPLSTREPEYGTHFHWNLIAMKISKLRRNMEDGHYYPVFPEIHGETFIEQKEWTITKIKKNSNEPDEPFELSLQLKGKGKIPEGVQVAVFAGIVVYNKDGEEYYALFENSYGWCLGVW